MLHLKLWMCTDRVGTFSGIHTHVMPHMAMCSVCHVQLRMGTKKQRRQVRKVREGLSEGLMFQGRESEGASQG